MSATGDTSHKLNLMLLAAGEGTRLRPYTEILPKPAIPFLGAPLLHYSLSLTSSISLQNLVINTFHLADKMRATIDDTYARQNHRLFKCEKIYVSHETPKILGSGGGIMQARRHLLHTGTNGTTRNIHHSNSSAHSFLMMNADEVILARAASTFEDFVHAHQMMMNQDPNHIATILTMKHHEVGTKFGGVWVDNQNQVLGFGLRSKVDPNILSRAAQGLHFIGPLMLSENVCNYLPTQGESNIIYDGLVRAIADGKKVVAYEIDCEWFETGNPADFLLAQRECLNIIANRPASNEAKSLLKVIHAQSNHISFNSEKMILSLSEHFNAITDTEKLAQNSSNFVVCADAKIQPRIKVNNAVIGVGKTLTADLVDAILI